MQSNLFAALAKLLYVAAITELAVAADADQQPREAQLLAAADELCAAKARIGQHHGS